MTTDTSAISSAEILSILPHRFPILLVDKVLELAEDKVVAIKNVSWGEPYFQGHFPDMPIMPGVLIVEALAQAGGVLALKSESINPDTHVMFFLSINNVKFRKTVTPGDQLRLEVVPLRKGKVWKMRGEAFVDETLVCEAEFMASLVARDENTSSADKT